MVQGEWLKSLPVPTPEQTAQFADHVADSHSWYKHLPFFPPGASFVFFPNPHEGRGVKKEGERFVVYDIERGNYFDHYSRLPTAEYIAQFGYWDYWVDDNPRVLDPQPGPWLYAADGRQWDLLAEDLKRQWSCRVTAFLKPAPQMFQLQADAFKREVDAFLASSRRSHARTLLGVFRRRGLRQTEDEVVGRYRAVAGQSWRAAGTWGDRTLFGFMESEARAQRELLLDTLHRVRADWTAYQGSRVEQGAGADRPRG
jgi:hypothetical protein